MAKKTQLWYIVCSNYVNRPICMCHSEELVIFHPPNWESKYWKVEKGEYTYFKQSPTHLPGPAWRVVNYFSYSGQSAQI